MTIKERLEQNNNEIAVCIELAKQFSSAGVATGLSVGASETATKNEEATNGNVHLNLTDKNGVMDSHKIVGIDGASVTSDENGTITVSIAAAGTSLGGVKSGGDVTIKDGTITINDDSHNHVISNIDGLQSILDGKLPLSGGIMTGNITFTDAAGTGIITNISSTVTGGWSRGWDWKTTSGRTGIGCLGNAANFTHMYVGGDWQKPWMKVQPNGNVTATKFIGNLEGNATGLAPTGTNGYTTDVEGNFIHKTTTATDYWCIKNNAGAAKVRFYWENGDIVSVGNVIATEFIGALEGTANFSKKINECQTNTINSTTNDTVANWGRQNTSIHFYDTSGLLNN